MDRDNRIKLLKDQLQKLDDYIKKSEFTWKQSVEYYEKAKLTIHNPPTNKELAEIGQTYRTVMMNQIEVFRSNSQMIRKMSPKAGDFLDEKIKKIEENDQAFQKLNFDLSAPQEQIEPLIEEFHKLFAEIYDDIELFRIIIHDTIKKFEDGNFENCDRKKQ